MTVSLPRRRHDPAAGIVRRLRATGALSSDRPRRRALSPADAVLLLALTGSWLGPIAIFLAVFQALAALPS